MEDRFYWVHGSGAIDFVCKQVKLAMAKKHSVWIVGDFDKSKALMRRNTSHVPDDFLVRKTEQGVYFYDGSFVQAKDANFERGLFGACLDLLILDPENICFDMFRRLLLPRISDKMGKVFFFADNEPGAEVLEYFNGKLKVISRNLLQE